MTKQDIEREYNSFTPLEKDEGRQLYETFQKFASQYGCYGVRVASWESLTTRERLTYTRTMKVMRYALGVDSSTASEVDSTRAR